MRKLIAGLHEYQHNVFQSQKSLFERLAGGQSPEVLFITCSDSRVNPNLITQSEPGELFILRNAGNLIPAHGSGFGGEAATIEFAVTGLGVKDIVVCGHSNCGAMSALCYPEKYSSMPTLLSWLTHAEATRHIVKENYGDLEKEHLLNIASQENVLVQVENLKTHPSVAAKLARGELNLHAWMYKMESGTIFGYEPSQGQFTESLGIDQNPQQNRKSLAKL